MIDATEMSCYSVPCTSRSVYINSDVIFGVFHLLGYQFSPRLADLGKMRFWRMDPAADYGTLNGLVVIGLNVRTKILG